MADQENANVPAVSEAPVQVKEFHQMVEEAQESLIRVIVAEKEKAMRAALTFAYEDAARIAEELCWQGWGDDDCQKIAEKLKDRLTELLNLKIE